MININFTSRPGQSVNTFKTLTQDQSAKTLLFVVHPEIQTLMLASLLNILNTPYVKLIKIKSSVFWETSTLTS